MALLQQTSTFLNASPSVFNPLARNNASSHLPSYSPRGSEPQFRSLRVASKVNESRSNDHFSTSTSLQIAPETDVKAVKTKKPLTHSKRTAMLGYLLAFGVGQIGRLPRGDANAATTANPAESVQEAVRSIAESGKSASSSTVDSVTNVASANAFTGENAKTAIEEVAALVSKRVEFLN